MSRQAAETQPAFAPLVTNYQPGNPNPNAQTYTPGVSTQALETQPFVPVVTSWKPAHVQPDSMAYTPGISRQSAETQPAFAPLVTNYQPGNPNPNAQTYTPGISNQASDTQPAFAPLVTNYQPNNPNMSSQSITTAGPQTYAYGIPMAIQTQQQPAPPQTTAAMGIAQPNIQGNGMINTPLPPQAQQFYNPQTGTVSHATPSYSVQANMSSGAAAPLVQNWQPQHVAQTPMLSGVVTAPGPVANPMFAGIANVQPQSNWNYSTTIPVAASIPQATTQQWIDMGARAQIQPIYRGVRDSSMSMGDSLVPAERPQQDREIRQIVDISDISQQVFRREQQEATRTAQRKREEQALLKLARQNIRDGLADNGSEQLPSVPGKKQTRNAPKRALELINRGISQNQQPLRSDSPVQSDL